MRSRRTPPTLTDTLISANSRAFAARAAFTVAAQVLDPAERAQTQVMPRSSASRRILAGLERVSGPLANSYRQILQDLAAEDRVSFAGTAHEIREIVATLLRLLAPEKEVRAQEWFHQEPETSGPTQKQRVKLILQRYGAGSKERDVATRVVQLEDLIGDLVRDTYSRASDAAHRHKSKREVKRILAYFEAFAHDLLDLD